MGKVLTKMNRHLVSFFCFTVLFGSLSNAEDLYYCFRLEGLRMSCAGGIEGPPITSPPDIPCTETCETTPQQCGPTAICRGKSNEKTCPGSGVQPDCSQNKYCTIVVATNQEPVSATSSCTYPTGTRLMCGSPIKGNGEGCGCSGSCSPSGGSCVYSGTSPGCTSSCSCGPGNEEVIMSSKSWCADGGTAACNVYQRNVPTINDGACGCRCPDPGGSLMTPECGGARCTPEARPPECR